MEGDQQVYSLAIQALFERKGRLVEEGKSVDEVDGAITRLQRMKEIGQLLSGLKCEFTTTIRRECG